MTLEEAKKIRFCNGRGYSTIEFIQALQLTEEIKNNNTMTEKNKQLLLKDLCSRLPYGTIVLTGYDQESRYWNEQKFLETPLTSLVYEAFSKNLITFCKPYLRPMSSMTEEEENELTAICVRGGYKDTVFKSYLVDDWLNKHHFDYRKLIEKGLALEAPKDMYKTE